MFLLTFNKEIRQLESIISDLVKKMKKSQTLDVSYKNNSEIFKLDTVVIYFDTVKQTIVVKDKSGNEIVSVDCKYDNNNEVQKMKFNMFSNFLDTARKIKNDRSEESKRKLKEFKEATKRTDKMLKEKKEREEKEKILSNALNRLREL